MATSQETSRGVSSPPEEGYHLTEDLLDHAIGFVHDSKSIRPDRPFFMYLAFGAMHAPHQAPQSYLDKYRGRYDAGWDVAREQWFARQVEMGLVPADTELAPRNPGVEAWEDLSDNERKLAARLQEAFAAFLDHTDAQVGRLLDTLEQGGCVTRSRHPDDRRKVLVTLTPLGRDLVDDYLPKLVALQTAALADVDESAREHLQAGLAQIQATLAALDVTQVAVHTKPRGKPKRASKTDERGMRLR